MQASYPSFSQDTERRHIIGLDLIRFMSAAMVMLFHLTFWSWAPPLGGGTIRHLMPTLPRFPEMVPISWTGWVGVEVFFVLSGFVIANSAEGSSAFTFFRSRFLRLMPAVWICASLVLAVFFVEGTMPFNELTPLYLKTLVLIPKSPWIDPVYWSLCVEVVFYGLILSLLLANRFSSVEFVIGTIGIASALCWIMLDFLLAIPGYFNWLVAELKHIYSWKAQLLLLRHGCLFAFGIYLWLLLYKRVTVPRLIIASLCFIGGSIEILHTAKEEIDGVVAMALPSVTPVVIWVIFVIWIIASVLMNDHIHAWAGRHVSTIHKLGLATYPLYLIHQTVGNALIQNAYNLGIPRFSALLVGAAVCIFVSWIIATALEPAFKQRLRPIFARMGTWVN